MSTTIRIIYDNLRHPSARPGYRTDWGFAAVIDHRGHRILFDAGASGSILVGNLLLADIDPQSVKGVFLTHPHFDHVGGLSAFFDLNTDVEVYVPASLRGVHGARAVHSIDEPCALFDGAYSTGELSALEQSLLLRVDGGILIVTGCSHPGIPKILKVAHDRGKPYGLVGGFHELPDLEILRDLALLCPTHCTHDVESIRRRFPQAFRAGGVGTVLEL